ncbi:hypothetical protein L249_7628 [Ophiocordyceps polyrhachis-furcata BCC 54312]|uniref:Ribosomal protein L1 n=1 Tax=Ophiocordyceps polyrhachis-furcata BCC 54312 TaxID=1330021 RepID=A0A367LAQ0_9HYPO|nr:hypothetical protein L249_7628 [Ophiocordyceps polyrhachis-furcata BCC 54312]
MAPIDRRLASMAGTSLSRVTRPPATSLPLVQCRWGSKDKNKLKGRAKDNAKAKNNHANAWNAKPAVKDKAKRLTPLDFKRPDLEKYGFPQYSLCEAMRIIRAAEVGQPPTLAKYELHITLQTPRAGAVIKGSIQLPAPAQNDWQIAVICPEGSQAAIEAAAGGAVAVGEEVIFEAVRNEQINFDRLLCHELSESKLKKANLGRILGPKGLMPSVKMGTMVNNVAKAMKESASAVEFRERVGVIHTTVGQLSNTATQLRDNIQALVSNVKRQCARITEEGTHKKIHEIVLSSTWGPALSLSGRVTDEGDTVSEQDVSGAM